MISGTQTVSHGHTCVWNSGQALPLTMLPVMCLYLFTGGIKGKQCWLFSSVPVQPGEIKQGRVG